jgi:hypothetical protein
MKFGTLLCRLDSHETVMFNGVVHASIFMMVVVFFYVATKWNAVVITMGCRPATTTTTTTKILLQILRGFVRNAHLESLATVHDNLSRNASRFELLLWLPLPSLAR